ncbi:uncharacterized protein LOC131316758 [Rhododendron vialii]|uniref:uncharacterized protein LOC131316758 n=1 Tax=Rhododendron vialii TaxID=182163 RepID=UPI00265F39D4|nr:uncharacterized protein LOC131316758 [Rhododendron vialii]
MVLKISSPSFMSPFLILSTLGICPNLRHNFGTLLSGERTDVIESNQGIFFLLTHASSFVARAPFFLRHTTGPHLSSPAKSQCQRAAAFPAFASYLDPPPLVSDCAVKIAGDGDGPASFDVGFTRAPCFGRQ